MSPLLVGALKNKKSAKKALKLWLKVNWMSACLWISGIIGVLLLLFLIMMMIFMVSSEDSSSNCNSSDSGGNTDNISGVDGDWTKKGTKSYNAAKSMFIDAKHDGCDDKHAAAVTGNGIHESAFFGTHIGLKWTIWPHQGGGGPGVGIYQFSDDGSGCPPPSNHSIAAQTKQILTKGGNDSEFKHASGSAYDLGMTFDKLVERGDRTPDRCALSQKAYELFHGQGGESDADDTADSGSSSSCGDSGDTSDIVKFAKSQLGKHPYSQGARNEIFTEDGKDGSHADCSSFGNYVYYRTGHVHKPSGNAWTTSANIYGLKKISASETKPGDSVVVPTGNLAHWMILLQKWHGDNTLVIDEGGCTVRSAIKAGSPNNVNISTYGDADSDNDHVFYTPEH